MNYYLILISFTVYVPNCENQFNYSVNEKQLVKANTFEEASEKFKNIMIQEHTKNGKKIRDMETFNLTIE